MSRFLLCLFACYALAQEACVPRSVSNRFTKDEHTPYCQVKPAYDPTTVMPTPPKRTKPASYLDRPRRKRDE
ncbi:hypothetical protein DSO57_1038923 [Entomophthora muscae]|uniref:Uncharacterized protein n=2 Tax=Entomophthora muscae TaxID=34485 RepID=A0ACC2U7K6_9FUNG|nr:hypothetical protein DSO57_1023763 [Entomophthora muscae]KAJ9083018.1 hypothetical protein DSO57_1038923 [Entomophthora muscae]